MHEGLIRRGRSVLNLTSLTKSTKLKIGIFIYLWREEIRGSSSGYPSKIFTWTFESPAFKRAAVNTDWVQTSDQVICQQNTANDIKMPSVFTSQVLMDLPLCYHHQSLCCGSMRTDFFVICTYWTTLYIQSEVISIWLYSFIVIYLSGFSRQLNYMFFILIISSFENELSCSFSYYKFYVFCHLHQILRTAFKLKTNRDFWNVATKAWMKRNLKDMIPTQSLTKGQQPRYTQYQSMCVSVLTLLTLWSMTLRLCSCLGSASHFIYVSGTAACKKSSGAGLTYKADNGSIHASNLRAASALSN